MNKVTLSILVHDFEHTCVLKAELLSGRVGIYLVLVNDDKKSNTMILLIYTPTNNV